MLERVTLVSSKAALALTFHVILEFLFPLFKDERGAVICDEFRMNLWQKLTVPKKLRSCVTVVDSGNYRMTSWRSGKGSHPRGDSMWPRNRTRS